MHEIIRQDPDTLLTCLQNLEPVERSQLDRVLAHSVAFNAGIGMRPRDSRAPFAKWSPFTWVLDAVYLPHGRSSASSANAIANDGPDLHEDARSQHVCPTILGQQQQQ